MLVRVGVNIEVGMILGRMRKLLGHILNPLLDRPPGNFRREAMLDFFFLDQVSELMNANVVFAQRVIESFEQRRL